MPPLPEILPGHGFDTDTLSTQYFTHIEFEEETFIDKLKNFFTNEKSELRD